MTTLDAMTPARWERVLAATFRRVSETASCAPVLRDIGPLRFQLLIRDRPDLSYWEEYLCDRVVPHVGVAEDCSVQASTTFRVFTDTLLRNISLMEAAADELWDLRGDTEALMRCANILPYVMDAFAYAVETACGTADTRA